MMQVVMDMMRFIIVALATAALAWLARTIVKAVILTRMMQGRHKECMAMLERLPAILLLGQQDMAFLKLKCSFLMQDDEMVRHALEDLGYITDPVKKKQIFADAFNYYTGKKDQEKARIWLEKIRTLADPLMEKECERVYDIFIMKSDKYLDELLSELYQLPDKRKAINEYLISVIYLNRHDDANHQKYRTLAQDHLAAISEELIIPHD